MGINASLKPLKALLIERTEGNPLFLEESVRTLVESRALIGEAGAYRLAKAVETIQVPATVNAILATRIDRLQPELKRLLQTAAVIGKDVPFVLLEAIAEMSGDELRHFLSEPLDHGMDPLPPGPARGGSGDCRSAALARRFSWL